MADAHGIEATFEIAGEVYAVLQLRFSERLDEVPRLLARVTLDGALAKPASLLGSEAKASVGPSGASDARTFVGLVTAAVRRVDVGGRPYLELSVEPPLFKLKKRTNLRTFLDRKVDEIVQAVLDGAGVALALQLSESYPARPSTIQYRETDLDFVRRLCSEEGISFGWSFRDGKAVFFDDPRGLADASDSTMPFKPEFGFDQPFACVQQVKRALRVVTDKVALRQYDFEHPRALVEGKAESKDEGNHALEVYASVRTADRAAARRMAQVLLDSVQRGRDVIEGTCSSWTLTPGERFTLEAHPLEAMNQEQLVIGTELVHEDARSAVIGGRMRTTLSFEAIFTQRSACRPGRRPAAARLAGLQLATTSGAPGQEIDVDAHARVTALFPWDRTSPNSDKASVRMRTMQLPTGGSMLLPRVGWEVLVQAQDGDPDTPYVTGRLYNGVKLPPYALPGAAVRSAIQTATTPGGGTSNELRTDDSKGKEEVFFNASRDMTTMVKNNTSESVGNSATLQIGGNQEIEITNSLTTTIGASQSISVGGNQKLSTETYQVEQCGGDYTYVVGGNRDMKVGGDHRHSVAGSETIEVGALKTDLVVGKVSELTAANLDLTVGAADVSLTPAGIALEIGGNHEQTIGAARVVISFSGIASEVGGTSMTQMAAARAHLVDADRSETAGATYTSVAAGAQIIKADNVVFEAETALTFLMGASVLSITPVSVAFAGVSVKIDGATSETAAMILDN